MNAINPLTPRTETVFILQGDDDERLRHLLDAADRLKPTKGVAPPVTLDEAGEYDAAKQAHDEFATEAESRAVKVVLRAVGRKTWRDLVAKHPPRDGNEEDKALGANVEEFENDLVPLSMASPVGSLEEIAAFLDSLNEGQFGDLARKAWALNMGKTADPTQRLLSEGSRN